MKILCTGYVINRIIRNVVVRDIDSDLFNCRCRRCRLGFLFLEEELELDTVLTKEVNILEDWTIVEGVASLIADRAWPSGIKVRTGVNGVDIAVNYGTERCTEVIRDMDVRRI